MQCLYKLIIALISNLYDIYYCHIYQSFSCFFIKHVPFLTKCPFYSINC